MADRETVVKGLVDAQPASTPGTRGMLLRICRAASEALAASGAGVSVFTANAVGGVGAASDPRSEQLADLQFVLGEGPGMDAFDGRHPVLVPDLDDGAPDRWPVYMPALRDSGVRAVFAFPLQVGAARLGVLHVFRERAGPLSAEQFADALTFADVTVAALLDEQAGEGDGITQAIEYRAELFQAQGMVMVQIGGTISEAMARLRAYAYAENLGLSGIARDVVAGRLNFDQDKS